MLKIRGGHVSSNKSGPLPDEGTSLTTASTRGKFNALQLKFTLSPGTYATMLLRELTKDRTDSDFQSTLTEASRLTTAAYDDNADDGSSENEDNNKAKKVKTNDDL